MEGRSLLLVTAAALVDSERRVLVQQRLAGGPMEGLWEFPGGKIEAGETPERALARELREELGIEVAAADLTPIAFASHDHGSRHLLLLLFTCRRWHGTPVPHAAQALDWRRADELRALAMPPADAPLIGALEALL